VIAAIKNGMTDETDVLIVGAGAAGLAATRELSAAKFNCIVLEARDRIGGRIHTHLDSQLTAPVELGAEFVHGKPPETFDLADRAGLKLIELPNTHWYYRNAVLSQSGEFWSKSEALNSEMEKFHGPDESFEHFLNAYNRKHQIEDLPSMATLYVEGFHAAHADRISVLGLVKTNEAAAEIDDERQFRPAGGYLQIAQWLHDEAVAHGAQFRLKTEVREVAWRAGSVTVTSTAGERFKARRVIITLPLGVLQRHDVTFTPRLVAKEEAASKLAVGQVVKVILRFRDPFWEELSLPTDEGGRAELEDFAFIHAPDELPPTWWTQLPVRAPLLVGWAGGTRAEKLLAQTPAGDERDALRDHSLQALSHIFAVPVRLIEDSLLDFYTHDWATDPFSLGAYSYIPVGGLKAQAALAEPIENTIYFAGEAANKKGHHGTVHGALASGLRTAQLIQQSS
jgi:monoamine oxidase